MHASSDDDQLSDPSSPADGHAPQNETPTAGGQRQTILKQHPWLVFVLPFVVYMGFNSFEPTPPEVADSQAESGQSESGQSESGQSESGEEQGDGEPAEASSDSAEPSGESEGSIGSWLGVDIQYEHYPIIYSLKILATLIAIGLVWPGYREFPLRVSPLAFVVGAAGVVIWVGLCRLGIEGAIYSSLGFSEFGQRPGFNPLVQLEDTPGWAYGFLAIRFFGLVVVVALIEEMFLRGFVMRYATQPDWTEVAIGATNLTAVAITTAVFAATHPSEILAAVAWFSAITWLMFRTKNIWDCVVAHGVTNLLMGIYVVVWDQWDLM